MKLNYPKNLPSNRLEIFSGRRELTREDVHDNHEEEERAEGATGVEERPLSGETRGQRQRDEHDSGQEEGALDDAVPFGIHRDD